MIKSAEEFIRLRISENPDEHFRSSHDLAEIEIWLDVIRDYPDYKQWVIHNKTIQIEILEFLSEDGNADVRSEVARKRKINDSIFQRLSTDENENVRYALMCNTKLSLEKKNQIFVDDSQWLKNQLADINHASR